MATESFKEVFSLEGVMKFLISNFRSLWFPFALIILVGIIKLFWPKIMGFFGEKEVAFFLSRLGSKKYMIINNLMVNFGGNTTQIDHLVISNFGIFVIETKNYGGKIYGSDFSDYWMQSINKSKSKFHNQFHNPIRQNYGHVQTLKGLLKEYPNMLYFPIIVFTARADLKIKTNTDVIYPIKLIKTIRKYQTKIVSDDIRDKIYKYLNTLNITDRKSVKEHIQRVRDKKNERKNKISDNICPRCGGSLIIRNSKYGSFNGCSNYPKCKFTFDIKKWNR